MDLLPDLLQVVGRLGERVGLAVEVVERLGPVDLGRMQVVEVEPQLLRELAGLVVVLVDQLAAVLGDLALGEVSAARPAAAAEPVGGLVEVGPIAQPASAGRRRSGPRGRRRRRRSEETSRRSPSRAARSASPPRRAPRPGEQLAPAQPLRTALQDLVDRGSLRGRLGRDRGSLAEPARQWGASHLALKVAAAASNRKGHGVQPTNLRLDASARVTEANIVAVQIGDASSIPSNRARRSGA